MPIFRTCTVGCEGKINTLAFLDLEGTCPWASARFSQPPTKPLVLSAYRLWHIHYDSCTVASASGGHTCWWNWVFVSKGEVDEQQLGRSLECGWEVCRPSWKCKCAISGKSISAGSGKHRVCLQEGESSSVAKLRPQAGKRWETRD